MIVIIIYNIITIIVVIIIIIVIIRSTMVVAAGWRSRGSCGPIANACSTTQGSGSTKRR